MLSQRRHGFHAVSFVWWHYFTHIFGVFVDVVYWDRIRIMVIGNLVVFCDVNYNHISVCCTAAAATHLYRLVVTSRRIEFFLLLFVKLFSLVDHLFVCLLQNSRKYLPCLYISGAIIYL